MTQEKENGDDRSFNWKGLVLVVIGLLFISAAVLLM
jgi:hypothetical protein